jgi:CRP-like cAMP-binding protein
MTALEHFKSLYLIDDDLMLLFSQIIETKEFNKGDIIFEPESYLKYIYFVESGLTRIFYYKNNRDITHYFFGPNTFSTGIESVFYQKPSVFGFQALTTCKISFIPFQQINELAKTHIVVSQIIQKALLDSLISFSNRFYHTQFQTALDRYQFLLAETPELLQNASLGHIASYLGISQQTLSVIRGQVV